MESRELKFSSKVFSESLIACLPRKFPEVHLKRQKIKQTAVSLTSSSSQSSLNPSVLLCCKVLENLNSKLPLKYFKAVA